MITKESVLTDLLNHSSKDKPLDNCFFYNKYSSKEVDPFEFIKQFGSIIHDLQCDQIDAHSSSKPFSLIFETDQGYFIARNREEALMGNHFNLSRVKPLLTISYNYSRMIPIAFPVEDPSQLNLL